MAQSIFEATRNLYRRGKITKAKVAELVEKGLLTPEEYEIITGEPYGG